MANCHTEFLEFLKEIELSPTELENLKRGRDSLRERIEKYYEKRDKKKPNFCKQGSFAVKTTIRQSGEDYDYDDGVYLKHLPENKADWPRTELVHQEILDAVDGHTDKPSIDKTSCVRVQYKREYHIDLAIYAETEGKIFLAKKDSEQWEENNPKLFTDWVFDRLHQYGEQFRSVIKYIKKWAYYQGYNEISGFLITILVGNNFSGKKDRDDEALVNTLSRIVFDLESYGQINRPVPPVKNITDDFSANQFRIKFTDRFKKFRDEAQNALNESNHQKSCEIWRELFGDEFPESNGKKQASFQERPATKITTETRPWGR
jgi:hypothetical protein